MQVIDNDIWKYQLKTHSLIKDKLLDNIKNDIHGKKYIASLDHIDRTDFFSDRDPAPEYYMLFAENAQEYFNELLNYYCMEDSEVESCWYQQYIKKDTHGWHIHPHSNVSFVYNLELENSQSSTEFYDRKTKKIVQLDVNEGDIVTFPSNIIHRSAPLKGKRKTIISVNVSFEFVDQSMIIIDK